MSADVAEPTVGRAYAFIKLDPLMLPLPVRLDLKMPRIDWENISDPRDSAVWVSRNRSGAARVSWRLGMEGLIDSGWAAWLPLELVDALEAAAGNAAARRAFARRLADGPGPAERERWERFALVCPSRVDLPASADGLTPDECYRILGDVGLVTGDPPRPVAHAEPVELVLTLDHDQVRELEQTRFARDPGAPGVTPADALPSLERTFGHGVGRNDPCPCGSGKKFKRCHGR